jgi:adenine-specific DNA-methyltransferase
MEVSKLRTPIELKSDDILKSKIDELKKLFPEAFSEEKIDFEILKNSLGRYAQIEREHYKLNWAGKKDCFKLIQSKSIATLIPAKEESINFDETENIFIEGDNLEVLKLLQKAYSGKIKMIYIDPPYNTGKGVFMS